MEGGEVYFSCNIFSGLKNDVWYFWCTLYHLISDTLFSVHSNFSACCILLFYDNAVSIGAQRKGWLRRLFLGSNPWYFDFWVFDHTKSTAHFHFCFCLKYFSRYLVNDLSIFLSVLKINWIEKFSRGGWSGLGMVPVGIHPTSIGILNGHPTEIPPDKMLGGVVQNCHTCHWNIHWTMKIQMDIEG